MARRLCCVVLFNICYALLTFTISAIYSVSTLTIPLVQYFGISSSFLGDLPALLFPLSYVAFVPLVEPIVRKISLRWVMLGSAILCVLGGLFRIACVSKASSAGFAMLLWGTSLLAVSQSFVWGTLMTVTSIFVPCERQSAYVGLLNFVSCVGLAIGFVVSSWYMQDNAGFKHYWTALESLYLFLNCVATVGLFLYGCCTENNDNNALEFECPPKEDESWPSDSETALWIGIVLHSLLSGTSNMLTILLDDIVLLDGFPPSAVSTAGFLYLVPCIPAPAIVGVLLDQMLMFRGAAAFFCAAQCLVQLILVLVPSGQWFFFAMISLYGIVTNCTSMCFLLLLCRLACNSGTNRINCWLMWMSATLTVLLTSIPSFPGMGDVKTSLMPLFVFLTATCAVLLVLLLKLSSPFVQRIQTPVPELPR